MAENQWVGSFRVRVLDIDEDEVLVSGELLIGEEVISQDGPVWLQVGGMYVIAPVMFLPHVETPGELSFRVAAGIGKDTTDSAVAAAAAADDAH